MRTFQDDNKKVQNPISTASQAICNMFLYNGLSPIQPPDARIAHRETLVTHCHRKTCNRQNPDLLLSALSTFCHYPAG